MAEPAVVPEIASVAEQRIAVATQWQLMWWRFRRHKPAVISMVFLLLMYFSTLISEFIAPWATRAMACIMQLLSVRERGTRRCHRRP